MRLFAKVAGALEENCEGLGKQTKWDGGSRVKGHGEITPWGFQKQSRETLKSAKFLCGQGRAIIITDCTLRNT